MAAKHVKVCKYEISRHFASAEVEEARSQLSERNCLGHNVAQQPKPKYAYFVCQRRAPHRDLPCGVEADAPQTLSHGLGLTIGSRDFCSIVQARESSDSNRFTENRVVAPQRVRQKLSVCRE